MSKSLSEVLRWLVLVTVMLISAQLNPLQAQSSTSSINDVNFNKLASGDIQISITGTGNLDLGKPNYVNNPSRIFFDLSNAILKYNLGRTNKIAINEGSLKAIAISQYQTNPDIVRIVMYFDSNSDESTIKRSVSTSKKGSDGIITYSQSGQTPSAPISVSETLTEKKLIEKVLYQGYGMEGDALIFKSPSTMETPKVKASRFEYRLEFVNARFRMPSQSDKTIKIPINSDFISEVRLDNSEKMASVTVKFAKKLNSDMLNYLMENPDTSTLKFKVMPTSFYPGGELPPIQPNVEKLADLPSDIKELEAQNDSKSGSLEKGDVFTKTEEPAISKDKVEVKAIPAASDNAISSKPKPIQIPDENQKEETSQDVIFVEKEIQQIQSVPDIPVSESKKHNEIRLSFTKGDGVDEFILESDKPIDQYRYSILNNPARLMLEFPANKINFNSKTPGDWNYINGNVTELIWLPKSETSGDWSKFYIYLKYDWVKLECNLSRMHETGAETNEKQLPFSIIFKKEN